MDTTEARTYQVHVTEHADAPIEQVWDLLATAEGWTDWTAMGKASLEREGDEQRQGVGAIRTLGAGPITSRERVVRFEPPHHFSYELLSGLPVRDYRADVTLDRAPGGGTDITWHSGFERKVPGTGWVMHRFLSFVIGDIARRLAAAATAAATSTAGSPPEAS